MSIAIQGKSTTTGTDLTHRTDLTLETSSWNEHPFLRLVFQTTTRYISDRFLLILTGSSCLSSSHTLSSFSLNKVCHAHRCCSSPLFLATPPPPVCFVVYLCVSSYLLITVACRRFLSVLFLDTPVYLRFLLYIPLSFSHFLVFFSYLESARLLKALGLLDLDVMPTVSLFSVFSVSISRLAP